MATTKGFIKLGNDRILPITRAELVLDSNGKVALTSEQFAAGGNNTYGLISATERALLQTGTSGSGMGIADIYTKLGYVNNGLVVGTTPLKFYNETTGAATPITVVNNPDSGITVGVANNVIALTLTELSEYNISDSFIRSITVDKYGRVKAVTGGSFTNDDIPETLTGKKLSGCVTTDEAIPNITTAIVNKKYVDDKFADVTGIASGGLRFEGILTSWETAQGYLSSAYINSYFKVTQDFKINSSYLYKDTGSSETVSVKAGDTLIVYQGDESSPKFVYIPSADDKTLITVKGYSNNVQNTVIDARDGSINLSFSSVFNVTGSGTAATITLPQATSSSDGYLSHSDYETFKGYKDSLKASYSSVITEGPGVYKLGTLTSGSSTSDILGKDTTYSLTLVDGVDLKPEYDPILRWSCNGEVVSDFTLKSTNSIIVKKNGNSVEFYTNTAVKEGSEDYLEVDQNKIGIKLGSIDNTGTITDGLVSFNALSNFAAQVHQSFVRYDVIENQLTDTTKSMHYGSTDLIAAITVTI